GERAGAPGVWQFPQGGAEEGFTLQENVLKELYEELGVVKEKLSIVKQLNATHEYEWDNPPDYAVNRWRGQTQTFWLVQFLGSDDDFVLDRFQIELMNWKWCSVDEVQAMAQPKRLPGYLEPLQEFEEYCSSL
ncbi:NUDIX domain-containing protein, partial [Oligoflexia bacterium]|nr:NUDIX domain-containing protein [Oligoflexia bacterium]